MVYDRTTASVAYSTRLASRSRGWVIDVDLDVDGTTAFAFPRPSGGVVVGWATLAEPRVHTVGLPTAESYHVKLAGGRIGFIAGRVFNGDVALARLGYVQLAGGHARVVATGADDDIYEERFDFDGERFAWNSLGCRQAIVHVTAIDARERATRHGCRLRFDTSPRVRRGRLEFFPDCSLFAGGDCDVRRVRVRHGAALVASGQIPGGIPLTERGRALLRRHHRLAVRIAATLVDQAGRHERRSTRTTITR